MDLTKKMEDLGQAFADFKKANDSRLQDIEKKGYAPADVEEKVDTLNDRIEEIQGSIKAVQTAMARPNQGEVESTEGKQSAYSKAFKSYLRKGLIPSEAEFKAMSVDSDPDGGFFVSPELSSEIVTKVFESSPMRQLASVQTISSDALEILQDLDESGADWVGETQSRAETSTPKIDKIVIPVHELMAQPKATQKLLDDAAVNIESWLAEKVSDKFARSEATAFVSGNGVLKPRGILTYAAGTAYGQIEQVNSGGASTLTPDGLINLIYSLKSAYKAGAAFLMKRATIKDVRKFKDGENQYLWAPGLNGNTQNQLLGYPIFEADDMETVGASALPVAFGNFKAGYQIVDRVGIRVIRDIYTAKPFVLLYTTKRVGGAVKNFEAIKLQVVAS